jgi:formate hydrogenlyase subunit 4
MNVALAVAAQLLHLALMLAAAPTVTGLLRWLSARLAGYPGGPPILHPWTDLARLMRKQPEVAENASLLFRIAPATGFGAVLAASTLVPSFSLGMAFAPLSDLLAIAGLLAGSQIVLVLAAMDAGTGAAGLAAGQVMTRGILAEPALLLVIFALALVAGSSNLDLVIGLQLGGMLQPGAASALGAAALAGIAFADFADPPGDLDAEFSGPALALVRSTAALRLLVWLDLVGALFLPVGMAQADGGLIGWLAGVGSWAARILGFCLLLAILRSVTGRLRWQSIPAFLGVTALLALLAAMLVLASSVAA